MRHPRLQEEAERRNLVFSALEVPSIIATEENQIKKKRAPAAAERLPGKG